MARRARQSVDSVLGAVAAMAAAQSPLPEPPAFVALNERQRSVFDEVLGELAREEWTPSKLRVAAQLARCQCDIEDQEIALAEEGPVVPNQRGTMVMNPRHTVLQQLSQRQLALMRCLGVTAVSLTPKGDLANARKLQQQATQLLSEESALLA